MTSRLYYLCQIVRSSLWSGEGSRSSVSTTRFLTIPFQPNLKRARSAKDRSAPPPPPSSSAILTVSRFTRCSIFQASVSKSFQEYRFHFRRCHRYGPVQRPAGDRKSSPRQRRRSQKFCRVRQLPRLVCRISLHSGSRSHGGAGRALHRVVQDFPRSVFFSGKLVFQEENALAVYCTITPRQPCSKSFNSPAST